MNSPIREKKPCRWCGIPINAASAVLMRDSDTGYSPDGLRRAMHINDDDPSPHPTPCPGPTLEEQERRELARLKAKYE